MTSLPPLSDCVLPAMLDRAVAAHPDRPLIRFVPGDQWSYRETQDFAHRTATALARLGVRRSDRVLVWLPSGPDIFRLHLALCYIGAIFVPINVAKRGGTLEHIIMDTGARHLIAHPELVDRLESVSIGRLETLVIFGEHTARPTRIATVEHSLLLDNESAFAAPAQPVQPWEPHGIFYTSGTTGAAKGVVCPHVHTAVQSIVALRFLTASDRFLINVPYYYLGGAFIPFSVIAKGASMVLLREFRTEAFWDQVKETGATCCYGIGAFAAFMMKQPTRESDPDNPLRAIIQQPLAPDAVAFSARFDVDVYTAIDMTEIPAAIMAGPLPRDRAMPTGYVGRHENVWPHFEVRLVDEYDCEVDLGKAGELILRCDMPWVIAPEYLNNPAATAAVWRNGWFHTGDLLRQTPDGDYIFVDRVKDSIRRRGENISSHEVESEVSLFDAVQA
jgi:carnitine-CoA ligase